MKSVPLVLVLVLGMGLCLVITRACEAPPAGPSRDSLALVRTADSLHAAQAQLAHLPELVQTAVDSAVADTLRFYALRRPHPGAPSPPPAADSMDLAGQRAAARYWRERAGRAEVLNDTAAAMLARGAVRLTDLRDSVLLATADLRRTLRAAEAEVRKGAARIGKLTADVREARAADRFRLGLGADLSLVPGVATLVAGGQVTTRRRLWLGGELEASAVGGIGVAATSADSLRTGLGGAARLSITF